VAQSKKQSKKEKDVMARLATRGEDVLQRLSDLPGGTKALKAFNDLRDRVDELAKKVRGIDALEARIAVLEKQVAALKPKPAPRRRSSAAAKPKPTPPSSTPPSSTP
jgi:uncharacterized small protein (DUF1192 family)